MAGPVRDAWDIQKTICEYARNMRELQASYIMVADQSIDAMAREVFDRCQVDHDQAYGEAIRNWKG
jgi:hypothetical protein